VTVAKSLDGLLEVTSLAIPEVKLIKPRSFGDERGHFHEPYNRRRFSEFGINLDFVQDNHAFSGPVHVLRGLHFQAPPFAQDKLVRVAAGAVFDVAVDIRVGSPSYGQWVGEVLSAENGEQLLVPAGFAHGYVTLEPDSVFLYKVTAFYNKESEGGLVWNDPAIGIDWGIGDAAPELKQADLDWPGLDALQSPFVYRENC